MAPAHGQEGELGSEGDGAEGDWAEKRRLAELVAELSSAVDRADRDRIVACYAEESFDDHGHFKGTGYQFADFVCGSGQLSTMHHLLGQSIFEVHGDEAWGETFWVFNGTAGATTVSGCGRYVDYFRKAGGIWKVKYRRVVPDQVPTGDDPAAYWQAHRNRADPSYDHRRWPSDSSAGE